jgi:hypothetical protein
VELNNTAFEGLEKLRRRLGAPEKTLSFDEAIAPLSDIEIRLKTDGILVYRGDIQPVGPYLTYRGEHLAILYILNSTSSAFDLENNDPGKSTPKFHLTWCRTLEQMTQRGKFAKYVLSRTESNLFKVEAYERDHNEKKRLGERHMLEGIRLFPCQNCLNDLGYKGFELKTPKPTRIEQVKDFDIKTFLQENDGNLTVMKHLPKTLAQNAKAGGYTQDFPEISRRLRKESNWTCTECGINMTDKKEGLHTHHLNGVKHDNRDSNLKVLCALCHKGVDEHHRTMHVKKDIERYIQTHRH